MSVISKEKLLEYLNVRLESKNLQINRLVEEGSNDSEAVCEWGIYNKVIGEIEKGSFDMSAILFECHTNDPDETCFCEKCLRADRGGINL